DTPTFRGPLNAAVRKLLPPYITSGAVIKAIGARDENVPAHDVAMRLRKLQHLRSTALVFQWSNHQWSKIDKIDNVIGTIAIATLDNGAVSSVPIESAIFSLHFFNMTPEIMNLLYPGKTTYRPSAEYRKVFNTCTLSELPDLKLKEVIQSIMVPTIMSQDTFEGWWLAETSPVASSTNARQFWEARSVLELHTLITEAIKNNGKVEICAEAALTLKKLFERLRRDMQPKDIAMLAECISELAEAGTPDVIADLLQPLRGKVCFWPAEINENTQLAPLEPWGKLSVKLLAGFVKATALLYTQEEMAYLGTILPQKCMNVVFALLPEQIVQGTILNLKSYSCDLILWIYKNKKDLPKKITSEIDMARCISALSAEGLPKEWNAALRDLRKSVFEKPDFQKYLIDNADGDIPGLFAGLQRYRSFQPGERQSVLVKLSRLFPEIKDYLESGAGSKMMGAADKTATEEAPLTSIASHKKLTDELQDLISVQIPENSAAVALARSYGDLRENAEYDAAKERRRYLHRRRAELERTLSFIQPTDFKNVEIKGHAVIGSVITLTPANGGEDQVYTLLGAWDGDPDKRYISYKTKIGEALLDKQVGDKVEIPGAGAFTIKAIDALPEDLRKALACED
ncbi:MAG: GreA/GreB family elongation factor, partial [Lentisphaeria bacterium]|nr:GreA/GreB family elongation factor [Lentisphaeria bacterium]